MNLHDLVTLDNASKPAGLTPALKTLVADGKIDDLKAHRRLAPLYASYRYEERSRRERSAFENTLIDLEATTSAAIFQAVWERDPSDEMKPLLDMFPRVAAIRNMPRTTLSSVRKVADALHMVLIPEAYLRSESVGRGEYEVQSAISAFKAMVEDYMWIYVLCPVDHYSVQRHIESSVELPIISPPSLSQAFMAITMSVPMFRAMRKDIETMKTEMRNYRERIESVEREVANLRSRVNEMASRLDEEIKARAAVEEARARDESARWYPSDPMMLGIPGVKAPCFDGSAIVGPCWGPDFPDIVATSIGLRSVKGQRQLIAKRLPHR